VGSGFCTTLSNVVISYPAQLSARAQEQSEFQAQQARPNSPLLAAGAPLEGSSSGDPAVAAGISEDTLDIEDDVWARKKTLFLALNLLLTAAATLLNVAACGQGPVAVVFPLSVAAGLSSNLVLQQSLGLAEYDKNARVGTSVLVIAVTLIARMGPTELPAGTDVLALVTTLPAAVFIGSSLVVMAGSMCALFFQWAPTNAVELLLFTLVGGTGTVLNASISKLAQMNDVIAPVRLSLLAVYSLLAVISVGNNIKANTDLEDPSLLVPISNESATEATSSCARWGKDLNPTQFALISESTNFVCSLGPNRNFTCLPKTSLKLCTMSLVQVGG